MSMEPQIVVTENQLNVEWDIDVPYNIPSDKGRTVRVAQIGYDMVAVSNTPTPEQIHSMLDRHATAAWPFAGSSLLRSDTTCTGRS